MPASFSSLAFDSLSSSSARRAVASAACSRPATVFSFLSNSASRPCRVPDFFASVLFATAQRLFGLLQLDATGLELVGGFGLRLERELLGLELGGALDFGRLGAGGVDELGALRFGNGRLLFTKHHHSGDDADDERGEAQDDANDGQDGTSSGASGRAPVATRSRGVTMRSTGSSPIRGGKRSTSWNSWHRPMRSARGAPASARS